MNGLIKAIALGVVRNTAAAAGAWLVAHDVTNGSGEQSFIGSVCFLASLAFTAFDKLAAHKAIQTALMTPPPATPQH